MAGDQVPLMPFVEVVGRVNVPPSQIAAIGSNVGSTFGFTSTVIVVGLAHSVASGVKV